MEKKYQLTDIVQETLLIPLYMRAMESRRTKDNILKDDMAERLTEQIDYDYNKLNKAKMSYVGCVVRAGIMTMPHAASYSPTTPPWW